MKGRKGIVLVTSLMFLNFHCEEALQDLLSHLVSRFLRYLLFLTAIICYLQDSHSHCGGKEQFCINIPQTAYSLAPQKLFITFKRKEWLKNVQFPQMVIWKLQTAPPGRQTTHQKENGGILLK